MSRHPTPYPLVLKIESPPPSDPTNGLHDLTESTSKLRASLDALERRNVAVDPIVQRIQFGCRR